MNYVFWWNFQNIDPIEAHDPRSGPSGHDDKGVDAHGALLTILLEKLV